MDKFFGSGTSKNALKFANAGNEAIFNDVFPKLADNLFGAPKKGQSASKWDDKILYNEQFNIVDPLYQSYNKAYPGVINFLKVMSSQVNGWGRLIQMPSQLKFNGNLMSPFDRFKYGKYQVTPFYDNMLKSGARR